MNVKFLSGKAALAIEAKITSINWPIRLSYSCVIVPKANKSSTQQVNYYY